MKSILFFLIAVVSAGVVPGYVQRRDNRVLSYIYSRFPEYKGHESMLYSFGTTNGHYWVYVVDTDTSYNTIAGSLFEAKREQNLLLRRFVTISRDNPELSWGFHEMANDMPSVTVSGQNDGLSYSYFNLYDENGNATVVFDNGNIPEKWKSASRYRKLSDILFPMVMSVIQAENNAATGKIQTVES